MEIFLQRLRGLRAEAGISQAFLADKVGLSVTGYQKIERGESSPYFVVVLELAKYYNVSLDYMAGRTDVRSVPH